MLEHRTQIHLSRIIRKILLNVFSVALIQSLLHDLSTGVYRLAVLRLQIIIISQSLFHVDSTSDTARFKNYHASKFVGCPFNLLRNYVIICYMIIQLWILTHQKRLLQVAPPILSIFVLTRFKVCYINIRLLCKISFFYTIY